MAFLFDTHSIAAGSAYAFDGKLPDFNWGTNQGEACHPALLECVQKIVTSDYSQVVNGRFKGGYITREFGHPHKQPPRHTIGTLSSNLSQ